MFMHYTCCYHCRQVVQYLHSPLETPLKAFQLENDSTLSSYETPVNIQKNCLLSLCFTRELGKSLDVSLQRTNMSHKYEGHGNTDNNGFFFITIIAYI